RDPVARAAYLAEACGTDAELRRRVEELLAAHDSAGAFLEQPAATPESSDAAPTHTLSTPSTDPRDVTRTHGAGGTTDDTAQALAFLAPPGRPDSLGRIGHYEVLEILGRGGFGVVFRAFDDKLQRVVAVKVLAPSMAATSPARRRFIREAQSS